MPRRPGRPPPMHRKPLRTRQLRPKLRPRRVQTVKMSQLEDIADLLR
ncbi:hypothetical protein MPTK1_4g05770 [Marchantia polymorpha subsp. ruderalis]